MNSFALSLALKQRPGQLGNGLIPFQIDHNAPCIYPQTFCITIVFDFWGDDYNRSLTPITQEKLETMVMLVFFGGGRGRG